MDVFPLDKVPESFEELLAAITPEIHANLKRAIELGRWENGDRLSPEQVELCLQAVIAYDEIHKSEEERIGYLDRTKLKERESGQ